MQMNSKELIGDCRKRFSELQKEENSFEEMIKDLIAHWIFEYITEIDFKQGDTDSFNHKLLEDIEYKLQTTRSLHWKSFYNGWLEGRLKLVSDERDNK